MGKIVSVMLDPEILEQLNNYSKKHYIPQRILVKKAINEFGDLLESGKYSIKHGDFDRLITESFNCSIDELQNSKLIKYAQNYDVSKRFLLRDIVTEYVLKNL